MRYYLGLDISTQGAKLVLLDFDAGKPAFVTVVNYDQDLSEYRTQNGTVQGLGEGVSESDPEMWITAVRILFRRLRESGCDPSQVRAISVSGQQHGLVCLDAEGDLTRKRSKLWNDVGTLAECRKITDALGGKKAVIREIQNVQKPGYTAGKILHFRKEDPAAFRRTATFFLVHNYVNWFLTGGKKGGVRVMEPGDTSGMALFSPATGKFSKKICGAIDKHLLEKLPPVKPADEFIGRMSPALCAEYGFPEDCMVDAGSGDNMYGAIGTGNIREGTVTISLGTSGTACTIFKKPYCDPDGEIASYCDAFGNYMALLCVSNLANGYNKALEMHKMDHAAFTEIISRTAPGNNGRVLLPWYGGERTPDLPDGTPLYFGFGLDDFTRENVCRAVLEGHVMNLYEGFLKLPFKGKELVLTGGIAKSAAWRRAIADIFEKSVVLAKGEGAALGAAIHAAFVGNRKDVRELSAFVRQFIEFDEPARTEPDPENVKAYRAFKPVYLSLSKRVRGAGNAESPFELRGKMIAGQV
jgi:xylulokinase